MQEIKTKNAAIYLISPCIVENLMKDDAILDVEDVWEMKIANKQLTEGRPYAVLVNAGLYTKITKEARVVISGREFAQGTVAKALLINSVFQQLIGVFYIRVNQPAMPTRLFTNRDKAIKWLAMQIEKANG